MASLSFSRGEAWGSIPHHPTLTTTKEVRMSTRVDMNEGDVVRGDPANAVLGRDDDEKPARVHGEQPPKPPATPLTFVERLVRDIRLRMDELRPLIEEVPQLEAAEHALANVDREVRVKPKKRATRPRTTAQKKARRRRAVK